MFHIFCFTAINPLETTNDTYGTHVAMVYGMRYTIDKLETEAILIAIANRDCGFISTPELNLFIQEIQLARVLYPA